MIRLSIALIVAVVALGGLTFSKAAEERRLRTTIEAHQSCDAALTGADLTASAARCPAKVAAVHRQAQASAVCDQALLEADLFVVRTACSTEVKTLFAQREAESRRADGLAEALAQERAGQAAAISRAETRVRTQTERKHRADIALQGAPRDGDLLVLDAGRLRQLGGDDAAAQR